MNAAHHHGPVDVDAALQRAEAVCQARGARFTPLRRRVFTLLAEAGQPVAAYELLDRISGDKAGGSAAPPTVYRALEFLQAQGLVHRLASQSRWVVCDHPQDDAHGGLFLVCNECGQAVEWIDERLARAVSASARQAGFRIGNEILPELEGICGDCREAH